MKSIVTLFLVLLFFVPVTFAENTDVAEVSWWDGSQVKTEKLPLQVNDKYIYAELPDGTIAIVFYFGNEKTADIAASFPGKTISSINEDAFYFSFEITGKDKYKVGDTIYQCQAGKNFTRIIVPDTVKFLDQYWLECGSWHHVIEYNIPEQLQYAGNNALSYLKISKIPVFHDVVFPEKWQFFAMQSDVLTFEQGYKTIPAYWCQWFEGKKIVIPEGVEKIEEYAFAYMFSSIYSDSLVEIQLPQTLNRIDDNALTGYFLYDWTPELPITLPDALQYIGKEVLSRTNIKTLTIPANLQYIDDTAFAECPLTNLTFSEGTTSITTKAFAYHNQLTNLILPTTLTTIGERCFLGSGLTKLVIPANVTTIGEAAFKNSENLMDITLPSSLTSIADDAFVGCASNAVFTVFANTYAEQWVKDHGYTVWCIVNPETIESKYILTIPAMLKEIGDEAFSRIAAKMVIVPDGATIIGKRAFADCENLCCLVLPDSVSTISDDALEGCGEVTIICSYESEAKNWADRLNYPVLYK